MNVGLIGAGAIGEFLLTEILDDPEFTIVGVAEINHQRAAEVVRNTGLSKSLIMQYTKFPPDTDIFIEAASASVSREVAKFALKRGKIAIIASISGLGNIDDLLGHATLGGGQLIIPSGAIAGLDALKAIPPDSISGVTLKTTKPARALASADYLVKKKINALGFDEPTLVFKGSAREAGVAFPKSANVATALGYASIGLDNVRVEIWVDPDSDRNRHEVTIESGHGDIKTEASNVPFEINPRTSRLAAWSILAALRNLVKPVIIGT